MYLKRNSNDYQLSKFSSPYLSEKV